MPVGIITGSRTYALPGFVDAEPRDVDTPWGAARVTTGRFAGAEVLHVSRHGEGHVRLSNHVPFRANAWALAELGAGAVVGCTACGAVDPDVELGSLVVFDDLHFPANRLPSGEVCTLFSEAGDRRRGHWIYESPFSEAVRRALADGRREAGLAGRDGGCYGHVDGPRFNTRAEIRQLARAGVTAVSQTGGPETVLFGELELPYALVGFATDYANGVSPGDPTPVAELVRLMGESTQAFAALLRAALPRIVGARPRSAGAVYRFEPE
jgi:purine nucleoside phosphorylase